MTMDPNEMIAAQAAFTKAETDLRTREAELEAARGAESDANVELDSNESDAALKRATGATVKRQSKERLVKQARETYERSKTAHEKVVRVRAESACEAERARLDSWTAGLGPIVKEALILDAKLDALILQAARVVTDGRELHAEFTRHARELGINPEAAEPALADARRYLRDALSAQRDRDGRQDPARWLASVPTAHAGMPEASIARFEALKAEANAKAQAETLQAAIVTGANLAAADLNTNGAAQ
jgi:hypothetical protein